MENAVEALKMAFAVIVLVIALATSMTVFAKARETSELMLKYSEPTEFYEYYDYSQTNSEDALGNRIVGIETIIPTLYKYSKERYKVTFKKGIITEGEDFTDSNGETTRLKKVVVGDSIEIYKTTTIPNIEWSKSYKNDFGTNEKDLRICSFDIDEEIKRGECWTADIKHHLDVMIEGGWYLKPQYNDKNLSALSEADKAKFAIKYESLLEKYKNKKFVELVGEVPNNNANPNDENEGIIGNKTTTKKVITYVLIN